PSREFRALPAKLQAEGLADSGPDRFPTGHPAAVNAGFPAAPWLRATPPLSLLRRRCAAVPIGRRRNGPARTSRPLPGLRERWTPASSAPPRSRRAGGRSAGRRAPGPPRADCAARVRQRPRLQDRAAYFLPSRTALPASPAPARLADGNCPRD